MLTKPAARRLCILNLLYRMAPDPVPWSLLQSTLEGSRSAFRGTSRDTWFYDLKALRRMGAAITVERTPEGPRYTLLNAEQVGPAIELWGECADRLRELDRFRGLLGGADHDQRTML